MIRKTPDSNKRRSKGEIPPSIVQHSLERKTFDVADKGINNNDTTDYHLSGSTYYTD